MTWQNNLIEFSINKQVGKCPVCKSDKVNVTEHKNGERMSITFKCENCGSSDHFDGTTK